jgi:N-acetyl-anhydromuramyl-L-alanine amidase AmpD
MSYFPDVYPWASKLLNPTALSVGPMLPLGVCIHYLADRDITRAIESLTGANLGYHLIIDRDGKITQTTYFNLRVNHAGLASWNNLSPNRSFISVALASWGYLTDDHKSWNGLVLPEKDIAKRKGNLDQKIYCWDKATIEQEKSLEKILLWLISKGIDVKNICGHDESALPLGRKQDPGGVISKPMKELRAYLATMQSKSNQNGTNTIS